jgi:hypothetical protein
MKAFNWSVFSGFAIGLGIVFFLFIHNLEHKMTYRELHRDIDKNLTIRQATFRKFPNQYKLDYADWKKLNNK